MSFFSKLFGSARAQSLVLIDISAGSVAGGYARYQEGAPPILLYSRRLPIEIQGNEPHERAMLRALGALGSALISEGAPILMRHTGSGSADTVFFSVDAPWQETKVRTESFERKTPFTFTKSMVATALEKTSITVPEKVLADESVIGTTLNGYETREPYGKKVTRATIIVLTSFIDARVSEGIVQTLRGLFHTRSIFSIAGSSLRYQAMRAAFPHERNALIFDIIGPLFSIALVRKGFLVAVTETPESISVKSAGRWTEKVVNELTQLAERYPLPRTIFLLAQEQDIPSLEEALTAVRLGGLWLSDNPPRIVSVMPSHLSEFVQQAASASPDLSLLLMALYWQYHFDK